MDIFKVGVSSFQNMRCAEFPYIYDVSAEDYNTIYAIKQGDFVIDINTGDSYYLLKRSSNGKLHENEAGKIELNKLYALSCEKVQKYDQTIIMNLKAYKQQLLSSIKQKSLKR